MERRTHYSVIVVGGGFAGAAAAIAAGRQGKSVLLIEKYNALGGAAVYDLVNPFMAYWTHDKADPKKRIYLNKGIFDDILAGLRANGGLTDYGMTFNEEILKYVLNQMAVEAGVTLLYQSVVVAAKLEGDRIASVTVSNVSGLTEFTADCFVDATGDANLVALSGCGFALGRESDHLCQPMTLCFRLAGVKRAADYGKTLGKRVDELYAKFQSEGKIKNPRENVLVFQTMADGVLHFNTTRVVKRNPTDAFDVSAAEIEAREQVIELYHFLRDNFEEFRDSVLLSTGVQIGARESRMVIGEYTLCKEDLLAFTKFPDGIAACCYDLDIHSPDGSGTSHYFFPVGEYYTIPYRSLVARDAANLLVAGRCVSATHEAQASLRIMPVCCTTGEAAGVAAALVSDSGLPAKAIDTDRLRSILRENGAVVD